MCYCKEIRCFMKLLPQHTVISEKDTQEYPGDSLVNTAFLELTL